MFRLYRQHVFYNMNFKIELILYIASESASPPPLPNEKFRVSARENRMQENPSLSEQRLKKLALIE